MKVYLIEESSGVYEDYHSYIRTGFFSKDKAQEYIDKYNTALDESVRQGSMCCDCRGGKFQYLSHVIINCPLKARKSDISDVEKLEGDLYFECEKYVDYYDVYEKHHARIVEIEVEE